MCKKLSWTVLLVALLPLVGCGQSADDLVLQQIDQMNEYADAIEAGSDKAEIEAIGKRMKETEKALEDLNLSDDEKKALAEKHGEEMGKAVTRVMKAGMSQLGEAMQGMMKGMQGQTPKLPDGFPQPPKLP